MGLFNLAGLVLRLLLVPLVRPPNEARPNLNVWFQLKREPEFEILS
jgi:hypothetical protein